MAVLVNALHLGNQEDLDALVEQAKASGLPTFVGVAVPSTMRGKFAAEQDDMAADVVGRLGPRLHRQRKGKLRR